MTQDIEELWHCFIAGGRCACHRARLLSLYWPMTHRIARSFRKRSGSPVDQDELVSWGTFGLVHAVDTWDPTRGVRFESWAALQIRGRILDEVRTQDWAPRTVRRRQRELDIAYEYLLRDLGREPTFDELAAVVRTTEHDIRLRFHETESAKVRSLDESFDPDEDHSFTEPEDPHAGGEEHAESRDFMERVVSDVATTLDPVATFILVLYYFEGLSLEQIARVVGLAEHRVSQIHATTATTVRSVILSSFNGSLNGSLAS